MKLKELEKHLWDNSTLWQKAQHIWWGAFFTVQDKWWLLTGTCPHEGTVKKVGGKKMVCLLCGKVLSVKSNP